MDFAFTFAVLDYTLQRPLQAYWDTSRPFEGRMGPESHGAGEEKTRSSSGYSISVSAVETSGSHLHTPATRSGLGVLSLSLMTGRNIGTLGSSRLVGSRMAEFMGYGVGHIFFSPAVKEY